MLSRTIDFNLFISQLPENLKNYFQKIAENRNIISKELCEIMISELGIDIENVMIMLLPFAAEFARVPVSNYKVGAVVLCKSGNIYLGSNMEFIGEPLSCSIHAEQSAINNAWLNGENEIVKIAVTSAPCGYCRQFINELTTSKKIKVLLKNSETNNIEIFEMRQLLPNAFGPKDLNKNGGLLQDENHNIKLDTNNDVLISSALQAAKNCYSPYTKNYSGVSLKLENGKIFSGRYAENAAHNPSFSPIQSALTFLNMNSLLGLKFEIVDAVLVETKSLISFKNLAQILLSTFGDIKLRYYNIKD